MNLGIYCAGGFGKEIFDIAIRDNSKNNRWDKIFFIDDNLPNNSQTYISKSYTFDDLSAASDRSSLEIVIANGEPAIKEKLYRKVKTAGFSLGKVIDPSAIISPTAFLGEGTIITFHCTVASSAVLGNNVALNVKAIVGHDITINDHSVISSMVNIGGACVVGARTYIGMASQIKEGLIVGNDVIIGMGSVVHHDIPDEMIAIGNPARPIRKNIDKRVFK